MPDSRRILVLGPPFLRSLVREIVADARDVRVVGEIDLESELVAAAERTDAQFVIVPADGRPGQELELDLLERRPRTRILALAGRGRDAVLWELRPHRTLYGEISAETLLGAIRSPDWRTADVG